MGAIGATGTSGSLTTVSPGMQGPAIAFNGSRFILVWQDNRLGGSIFDLFGIGFPSSSFPTAQAGVHLFSTNATRGSAILLPGPVGEVMVHFDGSKMALWNIAKKYTLADNFFQGAFGGSFLNHQYLICTCAPLSSMLTRPVPLICPPSSVTVPTELKL